MLRDKGGALLGGELRQQFKAAQAVRAGKGAACEAVGKAGGLAEGADSHAVLGAAAALKGVGLKALCGDFGDGFGEAREHPLRLRALAAEDGIGRAGAPVGLVPEAADEPVGVHACV